MPNRDTVTVPREVFSNAATKSDGGVEGNAISGTGPALEQSRQPETPSAGIKPGPSDAKLAIAVSALEFVRDGYGDQDVNHVDYRVRVYEVALDALAQLTKTPSADHDDCNLRGLAEPNHQPHAVSQGWQPIETAPRDGTPFIGAFWSIRWADSHRRGDIVRCWYQPEFDAFISSCREMTMAPGYTINGKTRELHSPRIEPVTHWMPLPAPPSPAKTGGVEG